MTLEGVSPGTPGHAVTLADPILRFRIRAPAPHATSDSGAIPKLSFACWDEYTVCVYAVMGEAIVRVSHSGDATVVAGHPRETGQVDGAGLSARFHSCTDITSDGQGHLYVVDNGRLRRLQLPAAASWGPSAASSSMGGARGGGNRAPQQQQQGHGQLGRGPTVGAPEEEEQQVQVTTFYCPGTYVCASYGTASRSLLLCTDTAVYRLPTADLGPGPARVHQPVLVAGSEEEEGSRDGRGAEARFHDIWAMAVDGTGTAWVLDRAWTPTAEATRLARVDPGGAVTTVPVRLPGTWTAGCTLPGMYFSLAVLRNGCLALVPEGPRPLLLLPLGLTPCSTPPSPGSDCGSSCGP